MKFPSYRARRTRSKPTIRKLVRENRLNTNDLIQPVFVVEGENKKEEIPSMPGVYHLSLDRLEEEIENIIELEIPGVIIFGVPGSDQKDRKGSEAYNPEGISQRAIKEVNSITDELTVISDVCFCGYTSHGHCGLVQKERLKNDATLELLKKTALTHAKAGVDVVAPSGMIDGQVKAIRSTLEEEDFKNVSIMSYSAKYHSNFYGPFRDAGGSAPKFGDRSGYQMETPNSKEALREIELDINEGADIVMVKPALAYMDIISRAANSFNLPVAAYNVSGEYAMLKAAEERGWIKEKGVMMEMLTGFKRAGADMIITYFAKEAARYLAEI